MTDRAQIQINERVAIPLEELTFRASRSGGPGGQHVNTSSTRIELWWDLGASPSLDEAARARARHRLATRLGTDGRLRLVSSGSRSQTQNRREVVERFRLLLAEALRVPKKRKATKPTRASRERRLGEKRKQSEAKQRRRRPGPDE